MRSYKAIFCDIFKFCIHITSDLIFLIFSMIHNIIFNFFKINNITNNNRNIFSFGMQYYSFM